jgi:hypothetical protein
VSPLYNGIACRNVLLFLSHILNAAYNLLPYLTKISSQLIRMYEQILAKHDKWSIRTLYIYMMNDNYLYAHKPPTLTDNIVRIIDKLKTNTREVGHVLYTHICLRVSEMGRILQLSNILIDLQYSTSI